MSFVYDPTAQSCHDVASRVTGTWSGGGVGAGNEQRCFALSHPDWAYRACFFLQENDIFHEVRTGDLSKNEISVTTTYGPDPHVQFGPLAGAAEGEGVLPRPRDLQQLLHDAVSCLYSHGGKDPIRIEGLMNSRGAKAP